MYSESKNGSKGYQRRERQTQYSVERGLRCEKAYAETLNL